MKKIGHSILSSLLVFTMLLSLLSPVAFAQESDGANIVTYIPIGSSQPHTIHWLRGITPPTMPGQTLDGHTLTGEQADMKLINGAGQILDSPRESGYDSASYEEYYVSGYLPGNGWYDVNKFNEADGVDSELCFALAAGNLLYWWIDQNETHIDRYQQNLSQEESQRLESYQENLKTVGQEPSSSLLYKEMILPRFGGGGGGWGDIPLDYFLNGYSAADREAPRNIPSRHSGTPAPGGGLFYPVFGKSILTDRQNWPGDTCYENLNRDMKTYMDEGIGVCFGYSFMTYGAHAVTVWGAEYDENDRLCAVYMTDNNDSGREPLNNRFWPEGDSDGVLISMIRYPLYQSGSQAKISTLKDAQRYGYGSQITGLYSLTLAQNGWEHYEAYGTPLYPDGRAFLSPILIQEHTITLDPNGGSVTPSSLQTEDSSLPQLPVPTWTGHEFLGWYTKPSGGFRVYKGDAVTIAMTLYAHWEEVPVSPNEEYTVSFNANGGTVSPSSVRTSNHILDSLPTPAPRSGYHFLGWYTQPEGGIKIDAGHKFSSSCTLFALWEKNDVTLSFNSNGGSHVPSVSGKFGDPIKAPDDPTREGYTFTGWSPELPSTFPANNRSFTALWEKNDITLSFNSNDGSHVPSISGKFGDPIKAPIDPTREGYTFAGWSPELPSTFPAESKTFIALWEEIVIPHIHSFGPWEITKAPSYLEEGLESRHCICGETETRSIPKLINPFTDIPQDAFFTTPVLWAVGKGITDGITPTEFRPNISCTRAQILTFLWRNEGSPEPQSHEHPFTDLDPSAFYYKAVLWAVENGITDGMTPTTFCPELPCSRAQGLTFLWRTCGKPASTYTGNIFKDVVKGSFYYDAVLWAVGEGITDGMTPSEFWPEYTCTRGQIITFIYRSQK